MVIYGYEQGLKYNSDGLLYSTNYAAIVLLYWINYAVIVILYSSNGPGPRFVTFSRNDDKMPLFTSAVVSANDFFGISDSAGVEYSNGGSANGKSFPVCGLPELFSGNGGPEKNVAPLEIWGGGCCCRWWDWGCWAYFAAVALFNSKWSCSRLTP